MTGVDYMCGIVGYLGQEDARDIILQGLTRLEYRGYDSAGLALYDKDKKAFNIYKDKLLQREALCNLAKIVEGVSLMDLKKFKDEYAEFIKDNIPMAMQDEDFIEELEKKPSSLIKSKCSVIKILYSKEHKYSEGYKCLCALIFTQFAACFISLNCFSL